MSDGACVCVMAKAPVAGQVKTRMCPPLALDQAAAVATAFLRDTWAVARVCAGPRTYLARAGDAERFPRDVLDAGHFDQAGQGLGARIESVIEQGLARASRVIVIGSDMPGIPGDRIVEAERALDHADVVLGPSLDGGFYLIAARRFARGMLAGVPWSAPTTYRACVAVLAQRGFRVASIHAFDDVDDIRGLRRLGREIVSGRVLAPATAALLSEASWSSLLSSPS